MVIVGVAGSVFRCVARVLVGQRRCPTNTRARNASENGACEQNGSRCSVCIACAIYQHAQRRPTWLAGRCARQRATGMYGQSGQKNNVAGPMWIEAMPNRYPDDRLRGEGGRPGCSHRRCRPRSLGAPQCNKQDSSNGEPRWHSHQRNQGLRTIASPTRAWVAAARAVVRCPRCTAFLQANAPAYRE